MEEIIQKEKWDGRAHKEGEVGWKRLYGRRSGMEELIRKEKWGGRADKAGEVGWKS